MASQKISTIKKGKSEKEAKYNVAREVEKREKGDYVSRLSIPGSWVWGMGKKDKVQDSPRGKKGGRRALRSDISQKGIGL